MFVRRNGFDSYDTHDEATAVKLPSLHLTFGGVGHASSQARSNSSCFLLLEAAL